MIPRYFKTSSNYVFCSCFDLETLTANITLCVKLWACVQKDYLTAHCGTFSQNLNSKYNVIKNWRQIYEN